LIAGGDVVCFQLRLFPTLNENVRFGSLTDMSAFGQKRTFGYGTTYWGRSFGLELTGEGAHGITVVLELEFSFEPLPCLGFFVQFNTAG
jgi:hypothetical protein